MTDNEIEKFEITQIDDNSRMQTEVAAVREYPVTIIFNGQELVTLLCTPKDLNYLAIGYLSSEGFIRNPEEIKNVMVDEVRGVVRVTTTGETPISQEVAFKRLITSGCGRGASFYSAVDAGSQKIESKMEIAAADIFNLVMTFQHASELYRITHGVHSAALCDKKEIIAFSDDIGRHNAIDRVFGKCMLENIPTEDRVILTSGRCSSEILHKVVKKGVPVIVSVSVPTNLGIKIAESLGITLIGRVRGRTKMNIYSNAWRIS